MNAKRRNLNKNVKNVATDWKLVSAERAEVAASSLLLLDKHTAEEDMKYKLQLRTKRRCMRWLLRGFLIAIVVLYVLVPLLVYLFPSIAHFFIFLHFVRRPTDLSRPESVDLVATRNFYVQTGEDDIELGVWHVLPKSLMRESLDEAGYEAMLRDGPPIVIYLHGNAGSRASGHRIELYKVLRELNAHVLAVDYRGYADSSRITPSEDGVVSDAKVIYNWTKKRAGKSQIFVWGHSLGTGVAARAVNELNKIGELPTGLVLEAPFNNMNEEFFHHPMTTVLALAPWFGWAARSSLKACNVLFQSDQHITGVSVPILILHAEDDFIIPISLGRKLYDAAVQSRTSTAEAVSFIRFGAKYGLNHQHICRATQLPLIISQFFDHPERNLSRNYD